MNVSFSKKNTVIFEDSFFVKLLIQALFPICVNTSVFKTDVKLVFWKMTKKKRKEKGKITYQSNFIKYLQMLE